MAAGDDVAARFLAGSPNASAAGRPTVLRRMTSASRSTVARRTTTFSDLLSDSSDSDSSSDGGDALQRMREQADDMTYLDNSFGPASPELSMAGVHTGDEYYDGEEEEEEDKSFRMSTQPPRRKTVVDVTTNLNEVDGVILDSDEEYDDDDDQGSDNGSSFASSVAPNDHSFRSADDEDDDQDDEYDDDNDDDDIDDSFSSAMADEVDEDDVYDHDDYEEEEQQVTAVDPYAHEQEERFHSVHRVRLSEEPFDEPVRVSQAASASSAQSFSSAGDHFFVESVRGSVDSVAPVMDLPASPSPYSSSVDSSGSSRSFVGPVPPGAYGYSSSVGSSFDGGRSEPVAVTQPPLATLGIRVVDHTQPKLPPQPEMNRDSSSSSSSSSANSANDVSFSSNMEDSFVNASRPSNLTDEDLSFGGKNESSVADSFNGTATLVKSVVKIPLATAAPPDRSSFVDVTTKITSPVVAATATERPTETVVGQRKTKTFSRPLPPSRPANRRLPPPTTEKSFSTPLRMMAASVSPPQPPSAIDNSMASSRNSDVRLDFAGVFTGEAEDATNSQRSRTKIELAPVVSRKTETKFRDADLAVVAATAGPPAMKRVVSAQEASEIKVEEFFRKTYRQTEDDDDTDFLLSSSHSVRGRAKTSAGLVAEDPLLMSTRSTRSRSAAQTVDLKYLLSGQRIEELLSANEDESKEDEFAMTRSARALSRPSARLPINEDLLEEHFPSRPSTARSVALSTRRPPPPRPHDAPLTPITFSETSSLNDDDANSLDDSEASEYQSPRIIQRNFTLSLASGTIGRSSFTVSSQSSPNDTVVTSNYTVSPEQHLDRQTSSSSQWSLSQATSSNDPATPTLQHQQQQHLRVLAVASKGVSAGVSGSSLAASKLGASSGFKASTSFNPAASSLRSPNPMAASNTEKNVAPGFRWHPELSQQQPQTSVDAWSSEDGMSIKESVWHAAGALSIGSGRPSVAASVASQFQRVSTNVKSSFNRAKSRFFPPPRGANDPNEPTSPTSICAAPPKLPRGFDDRRFYDRFGNIECGENMIVVNKPTRVDSHKDAEVKKRRKTQMWLLLLGLLLGIVLGVGLVHVDPIALSFRLVVDPETGEIGLPVAVEWLLLPGSLFVRSWNCVTMPLLFCQVANGVAELTMTHNVKQALSFRAIGYVLVTSLLTTSEGIGMALVYHSLGLFAGKQSTLESRASSVMAAMGVSSSSRANGMAAMMCGAEESYLQVSQNGQRWRCSNETIPLPVQDGITVNGESWKASSAAVFAFTEAKKTVSGVSNAYYPSTNTDLTKLMADLANQSIPNNFVDAFSKSLALSIVVVALAVGLIVGMRAWHRSISAFHQLQQSQAQLRTRAAQYAESVLAKPHPILGVMVEFQLLLEWIADSLQVLAPIGVASIVAGHIVIHRDEWFVIPAPVSSLVLGVCIASLIHIVLTVPLLLKVASDINGWLSLPHFVSSLTLSLGTGDPLLATPVLAKNFEAAQVVTKSMSQVGVSIAAAVQRSGHGLYYPLAMLFLLETNFSNQGPITLDAKAVLLLAVLSLLGTFISYPAGPTISAMAVAPSHHLRTILMLFRAWTSLSLSATASTLPVLVAADVVIGHVVAMVSTHDHVLFTRLLADHCEELCVVVPDDAVEARGIGASPVYL